MPRPSSLSHAILISFQDLGVLLSGESGIGKSDCALELLQMGAKLVCDDAPLYYTDKQQLIGHCPKKFQGVLHIRGLGLLHIPTLFGEQASAEQSPIDLIIELLPPASPNESTASELLMVEYRQFQFKEYKIPLLQLEKNPSRPIGLLVSTAIKQFKLRMAGQDPCNNLI